MQLDRLTIKSQEALQEAQRIAQGFSHQEIDGEHLLLAMIGQTDSLIPELLEKIGVPPRSSSPTWKANWPAPQGPGHRRCLCEPLLEKGARCRPAEAGKLKDDYISTEHLLLGLLDEGGPSLKKIFQAHGLKRDAGAAGPGRSARQPARDRPESRRTNSRRSKNTAATSPRWRGRARSIR